MPSLKIIQSPAFGEEGRSKEEAPAISPTMFPTKEAFDKQIEKNPPFRKAISWNELKVNEIYKIEEKKVIPNGKFGPGLILRVSNIDGNSMHVWATQLISQRLLADGEEKVMLPCFIRPLGLRPSKKDSKRSYQAFQLLSAEELNC